MLNQVIMVGRLAKDPEIKETENGKKYSNISLAVPRSYKNENGEYETDFINCKLWAGVATNTSEYCKKGDVIGVKGRVETSTYEKDGEKVYKTTIVADKVTFLSTGISKTDEVSTDKVEKQEKKKTVKEKEI